LENFLKSLATHRNFLILISPENAQVIYYQPGDPEIDKEKSFSDFLETIENEEEEEEA